MFEQLIEGKKLKDYCTEHVCVRGLVGVWNLHIITQNLYV